MTIQASSLLSPVGTSSGTALYTRIQDTDRERSAGSQTKYDDFSHFVTAFHAEANDPNKVGMADFLDILNPLQHLPIIGMIYRELTGDTLKPGAEMMGAAVFGGGAGLAAASVKVTVREDFDLDSHLAQQEGVTQPPFSMDSVYTARVEPVKTEFLPPLSTLLMAQELAPLAPTLPAKMASPSYTRTTFSDPERTAGSIPYYA